MLSCQIIICSGYIQLKALLSDKMLLLQDITVAEGTISDGLCVPHPVLQVLEFDLKGTGLDSSSYIDVIVKDYETIGKDK